MLPDQFRKRVIASQTGLAFYYAIASFIGMSFAFGLHPTNIIINASMSSLFGLAVASKFHKSNNYLVRNIKEGRFDTTRRFNTMLKKEESPKTKAEKDEYLEFLLATEQNKVRLTSKRQLWAFVFLLVMLALYILSIGFDIWAIIFTMAIASAGYTYKKSKDDLKKIEAVKEKLIRSS